MQFSDLSYSLNQSGSLLKDMIALKDKCRQTGLNVFASPRILSWQKKSMENLAHHKYSGIFLSGTNDVSTETGPVEYKSKDGAQTKVFDTPVWLAAMCSHVPNNGEQMVRH